MKQPHLQRERCSVDPLASSIRYVEEIVGERVQGQKSLIVVGEPVVQWLNGFVRQSKFGVSCIWLQKIQVAICRVGSKIQGTARQRGAYKAESLQGVACLTRTGPEVTEYRKKTGRKDTGTTEQGDPPYV